MSKYLGIKVEGISNWLWFAPEKVTEENNIFIGKEGWGKYKEFIKELKIESKLIIGRMESESMQTDSN